MSAAIMAGAVAVTATAASASTGCTFASGVVRLNLEPNHQVRLLVVDGHIEFADLSNYQNKGRCGRATVWNTDRIRITEDDPGNSRLQFDQQIGRFAPGRTREASGRSEIEVNLGTLRDIWVMGRPGSDVVTVGERGVNINGDGDVDLVGSRLAQVFVFAADGDDVVRATGGAGTGDRWLPPRWGYLWASGGQGDDLLIGTRRGDSLYGDDGFDDLRGRAGRDWLRGGNHADLIIGGDGDDHIVAGSWPDTVHAGAGDDFIDVYDLGPDEVDGGPGFDSAQADPEDNLSRVESVS
jgi:Ca2+-binding RTX toxin-like protein